MSAHDDVATARRLLSPHFATDGEEDGPEAERIATAVETMIGSIAEALSVAREEGRQDERREWNEVGRADANVIPLHFRSIDAGIPMDDDVIKALEPFASIGQWLFARDVPDDTTMVEFDGLNGYRPRLTRGHFKAAFLALRTLRTETEN